MRVSIRPVTLRRVIETLDLSIRKGSIDQFLVSSKLKTTEKRAQEILLEMERMNFLKAQGKGFTPNKIAYDFLDAFEQEKFDEMHEILMKNYDFYRRFVESLRESTHVNGLSKSDLLSLLKSDSQLSFNKAAVDVLCDWTERLGVIQRNLDKNTYYNVTNKATLTEFVEALENSYNELNNKPRPGLKQQYVEIPKLRESVCEKLKISRKVFDLFFLNIFKKSLGKMELCGAPITTSAKKSRISLKKMKKSLKDKILSPHFVLLKEKKGIEIKRREYYYVAIFEKLRDAYESSNS